MNVYFKNHCKNSQIRWYVQEKRGVLFIFMRNICELSKKAIPLHSFFKHSRMEFRVMVN